MSALAALGLVLLLAAVGGLGGAVPTLRPLFGVVIPYAAFLAFLVGFAARVLGWAASPVPFRIPTTCGQQRSLPWIRASRLESPSSTPGVIGRMALEILCFRSLLRNTRAELRDGPRLAYAADRWLWLGALAFHWAMLVVVLRHLRFFLEPVPGLVSALAALDSIFQVGAPGLYLTDAVVVVALGYLLLRRLVQAEVRHISLVADYFALFLLLGLVVSGLLMRHVGRVDTVAARELMLGLVTLSPTLPAGLRPVFFVHLFLLSALLAYFPWSKLMHAGGAFLSPTRNLPNNSRAVRHVNPWNAPVPVHTYEAWEAEFRDKIVAAGLPLERE